jgi:Zn-dependent protease
VFTPLRLFKISGVDVALHPTFPLLLLWIGFTQGSRNGMDAAIDQIIFVLLLFVCVALHEFGHVWAAARYGIKTNYVMLSPIGGVAQLERLPRSAGQEIVIALAGPAVNLVIAAVLWLSTKPFIEASTAEFLSYTPRRDFVGDLIVANIGLLVFNLIPAFPMDGGRVLRAVLSWPFSFPTATLIAGRIGQAMAACLGAIGLYYTAPLLVVVAAFVFLAAAAEIASTRGEA